MTHHSHDTPPARRPAAHGRVEAEQVVDALNTAYVRGHASGLLTRGERAVLDFVWIAVRHRAGLTDLGDKDWPHLIDSTWRYAVEQVDSERHGKEAGR